MKLKILAHVICGGILVIGFQNCSQTKFGSADNGSQSLQALSGGGDATGNLTQNGDGTKPPVTPTVTPPKAPDVCVAHHEDNDDDNDKDNDKDNDTVKHKHASCDHDSSVDCDSDEDTEYVACILVDNGKSLRLGLVTAGLGGVNSTSESVCVTRAECLGDVAKAFNVEGAYERGYCEHNPNVKRLTDKEVKTLLGL
ncbi:MAG: hypothetical protein ACXVA9_08815 [Bdellovibrionales bacterium]